MKLKRYTYFFILAFNLILSQTFDKIGSVSSIEGVCNVENIELGRLSSPLIGNSIFNYDIITENETFIMINYCYDATYSNEIIESLLTKKSFVINQKLTSGERALVQSLYCQ